LQITNHMFICHAHVFAWLIFPCHPTKMTSFRPQDDL